jgi:ERCC4-related helicase
MKNTVFGSLAVTIVFFAVLGCSSINPFVEKPTTANSNKTLTDKAVDTAVGEEKIGIPECDEVIDAITSELNNPDDNFITKAGKAVVLNKIKGSIKTSVEENKGDKAEIAKSCREFKKELDKFKAEQDAKGRK